MQNTNRFRAYALYATLAVFGMASQACDASEPSTGATSTTPESSTGAASDTDTDTDTDAESDASTGETDLEPGSCATTAEFCCDVQGEFACQNEQDCPLVEDGTAKDAASDCGVACLGQDDACTTTCMAAAGVTGDCGQCVVDYGSCLTMNCLAECIGGDPVACTECGREQPSEEDSCSSRFFGCSGTTRNPDYTP